MCCASRGARIANIDNDRFALRVRRDPAEAIVAAIFEYQRNRIGETYARFILGASLSVGAWHLGAERDDPITVVLVNRSKLVTHIPSRIRS